MQYRGLQLDAFQAEAIRHLENGESVLVTAPTGTGKTIVADYVVEKAIQEKKSIIVKAEGEAESARLVGKAIQDNPGFVKLRKIDTAKEIATTVARNQGKVYLNSDSLLINVLGEKNLADDETKKGRGGWR